MDEIPVVFSHGDADEGGEVGTKVDNLKRDIENNTYAVDAPAVADAILRRLRLLKQGRRAALITEAGRSPRAPGGRPVPPV
jgi:hypothetical protein